jgi:septal ring factor EnvC (AmiA/AmiB activator)
MQDSAWVQNAGAVVAMFASCVAGVLVLVNLMLEPIRVQMASNSASISAQLASISAQMDKLGTKLDEVAKEVNNLSREVARLQVKVDMKVDKK